ncbi:vWA domain-containing protein [Chitinolyticbacter meiyuanensis]|uniref:vWA domain-containing protein n=1 Tax=Chitinolyticbacter meiyuanensis TaxID=682798 RepID=UPI0011E5AE2A|nr:VWA domain-containing protein [Chitinolyticbacter meiyuanensis]
MYTRLIPLSLAITLAACGSTRTEEVAQASSASLDLAYRRADAAATASAADHAAKQRVAVAAAPAMAEAWAPPPENRERYAGKDDNPVKAVAEEPVSTFSIDVDTGAYANVRRLLNAGELPPAEAVRVEELINYFPYDYTDTAKRQPFAVHTEIAPAPWGNDKHLIRIGIKAQQLTRQALPPANLVFLVDVSGSMNDPAKLPLLKSSLRLLVQQLRPSDKVSLVVYASNTGVVLEPTGDRQRILAAIEQLQAGGATAGEAGIRLAYRMARQGYVAGGINRILLATDGDFNVGIDSVDALKSLVERERQSGVSLTTLGFGTGNYHEALMEQLADVGNGSYHYIDTLNEGHKVLVEEMNSTLATVARDVKIQVEFNPAQVSEYRLVGYENRMLRREDFNNDKVDAGDVGAGHTVTALYEVTFAGKAGYLPPLRYGKAAPATNRTGEIAHLRLRYKQPDGARSQLLEIPLRRSDAKPSFAAASPDFRFASAVAGFGQLLRGGRYVDGLDYAQVSRIAAGARGPDHYGYRAEFERLTNLAASLTTTQVAQAE